MIFHESWYEPSAPFLYALQIRSHLLKKSLMENFIFCALQKGINYFREKAPSR